ncbi:SusD/RagB family nutrient-binding outer membrane lipoprotein [Sunxiuqinia sp. sy24]|uniref:SusD/RagB family nutrient-binding outer membrane lipoprotein n=1 Tax=Sunxiuqinia sp. sy24 TaxID=3461495 RepID=UPI0040455A07
MRNINMQGRWFLVAALILIFASCDDRFEEINTSPNDITDIPSEYLFANAVRQTFLSSTYIHFTFGGQYSHMYVGINDSRYIDSYFDHFTGAEYRYVFESFFHGPIRNINKVIQLTESGGMQENEVQHAMAQVIASVNFLRLADGYGSVPYQNGGYGQKDILYPEYDSVESIYIAMLEQLKTNLELLKNAQAQNAYPDADPLFFNDLSKWVRFTNSLRLRMAMRIRFVAPQLAETVIGECLTEPLIEENTQNAEIETQDSDIGEFQNPLYGSYNYWKWKMSELLVDQLKTTNDPRLEVFVAPNSNGEYIGIPNGLADSYFSEWDWAGTSNPSDNLVGRGAPIYFMSAAEIWLLQAEAALAGIIPGNANDYYQAGIRKAMEQWNVSQADTDEFLASALGTLAGTEEQQLEQICTQQWIAYLPETYEAWCNLRRTGYPKIDTRTAPVYEPGVSEGILPSRFRYPAIEANINQSNYLKAVEQQGPDEITTPLWWDVRD